MKYLLPFMFLGLLLGCGQTANDKQADPAPKPVGTPLIGVSSMIDKAGDLKCERDGKLPKEATCIDIREAKLETNDRNLKLFITVGGKAPSTMPSYEAAMWQATICTQDGQHCLFLTAHVQEKKTIAYVYEMSKGAVFTYLDPPIITNDTVLIIAPREKLPVWATTEPVEWYLDSEWSPNGEWHDHLPDRDTNNTIQYIKHPD